MLRRRFLLASLLLALGGCCAAGPPSPPEIPAGEDPLRWSAEVEALAAQTPPVAQPVVCVGSSSIRLWRTMGEDLAPWPVMNCGFGGSGLFDAVYWADRAVTPFDPRLVVVFSGTNDLAGDAPRSAAWVAARFDDLVARLRALGCEAPVVYLAISPTPARERHLDRVLEANRRIAERCAVDPDLHFVDTGSGLLDAEGRPDPKWFVADRLHLNADGYAHWTATLRPVLASLLAG
jgi:hypothetical protein